MSEINWELIIHRLDSIAKNQEELKTKINDTHDKVSKMEVMQINIDTVVKWKESVDKVLSVNDMKAISEWKDKIEDVVSPTQLKTYISDIDSLKTFKTKATMIWAVVQGIVFIIYFLDSIGLFKK
jgi:phage shock protein A